MNVVDRFVIGATLSASAVAHYATPHEMVTKLAIVPGALTAVLFPRFSTQAQTGDAAMRAMHDRSALALAALLLPVVAALAWWAEPLLAAWIDPAFARESAPVLQVLAWGMYASGVASVPYTLLQGAGHARSTAVLHAVELLPYVAVLVVATARWGLVGAALAWTLRCVVDAVALFALAARVLRVAPARAAGNA
jgi:O-antigen/teichoic acid export membrane protein